MRSCGMRANVLRHGGGGLDEAPIILDFSIVASSPSDKGMLRLNSGDGIAMGQLRAGVRAPPRGRHPGQRLETRSRTGVSTSGGACRI